MNKFMENQNYPDWNDIGLVSEYLSEWLQNCFGVDHDEKDLGWSTYPMSVEINITRNFDFEHLEKVINKPELNTSEEHEYNGDSGASIILKQKKLLAAYRVLQMTARMDDNSNQVYYHSTITKNNLESC